ncbi:polyamine-modulated factor 1-binding protein [Rhynchospora pubera]|uniref:Polyamine-modulated factor 1-binding protein n=1 Tax=Rhynchospora pubera TaxID=906938 RepID=A0AAV8GI01_9POAL|nr:polyamine-modulated factor 1-binding protein [Rhynchospora pubera]
MEENNAIIPCEEPESPISSLLVDISNQLQGAMQNMLKMTSSEVDQSIAEIATDMEKCRESVSEKGRMLEEERERFQKAALAVLEMLNGTGTT